MVSRKNKIDVVVASGDVLYRLGIKTILSVGGLDFQLVETDDMATLIQLLNNNENKLFIVSNDMVGNEKILLKKTLENSKSSKKVLYLGHPFDCACDDITFLYGIKEQKTLAEHFLDFFADSGTMETHNENVLSEREIEVLRHVALGLANKEIADRLFISTNTVITHRKNITEKLGIKTIPGLTVYAIMNKIINTEEVTY